MNGTASFAIFQSALNQYSNEITQVADSFVKKISYEANGLESPIIVKISIDYTKWSTVSEWKVALKTLLDEPMQSKKDIETCVWLMIYSSFCERYPQLKLTPQLDQVHCIIRFSNLPSNLQYKFVPFRHPVRLSLSTIRCVLSSFGDCIQLLRQTVWYCPKQCSENINLVINAERSITGNDKMVNKCTVCNEILKENEHRRSTYMGRWIQVFEAENIETPVRYGKIYRDVRVKLSDDMCHVPLVLGDVYLLIGTFDIFTQTYIAWNFQRIEQQ